MELVLAAALIKNNIILYYVYYFDVKLHLMLYL